jgi:hypothetical protein
LILRQFGLILVLMLIACASAIAAWKAFPQPQLGFIVEFPADPTTSSANYQTVLVPSAKAHIYSLKEDRAIYVLVQKRNRSGMRRSKPFDGQHLLQPRPALSDPGHEPSYGRG